MKNPIKSGLLALCALAGLTAQAAKLPLVDDFNAPEIDAAKWNQAESIRLLDKGQLDLARWSFGGTTSNTSTTVEQFGLNATDTAPAKSLVATFTVTDLDRVDACAANTSASATRVRLMSNIFNTRSGGPVATDMTGDVLMSVFVRRLSNSADGAGVSRAYGALVQCTDFDCIGVNSLVFKDLGTVALNTPVTLQADWDAAARTVSYTRDKGTPVVASYSVVATGQPGRPFNVLHLRNEVANCTAGRVKAGMEALVDNVGIGH
jgi:hypothetical protein